MKIPVCLCLLLLCLAGCKPVRPDEEAPTPPPHTPVQVVSVRLGNIDESISLMATSVYLKRNTVTAPIPAFITTVYVRLGDRVMKGKILYELESKERRALGKDITRLDTSLAAFGRILVRASASGIISTLDKQQPGDYVLEGTQLCTIAESNDIAFQVNVPFEYAAYTRPGKTCTLLFPDNSSHKAVFTQLLSGMNVTAQTETVLAKAYESLTIPENLIVRVSVGKGTSADKQILPKTCILSDEMMKEFWVMQLINDSTAVKIQVVPGNRNVQETEIISPRFKPEDKIIFNGNYGLPDTAAVKIVKE
jgi:hypothetical protein